ncbi:MAG: hypothetical protein WCE64_12570 [Bacteroidales bacterium]
MNYKKILLIAAYIFSVNILAAQNLKESLGGIKTNFQIYSDTVDLKVSDQIIILRAEKNYYSDSNFGTGWGYGYQSFHLEFITKKNIKIENYKYRTLRDNENKLELIFYDSNNSVLATTSFPYDYVDLFNNSSIKDSPFFYSIDLIDIPVVLLDKTARIGMIKKVAKK